MRVITLASRPDLADAVYGIPYPPDSPRFMRGNLASLLVRGRRVAERWPHLVVALLDGDRPVARGIVVGYRADRDSRPRLPDGGWDQVAVWAAEDVMDRVEADTACALEIAVDPAYLRRGLSGAVLAAMRSAVASAGLNELLVPLRPPDKARSPDVPMDEYAARTRADGLPADRWLRTHVRAGGRVEGVAWCSSTVQATLARWREWTGLPFDRDGSVVVPRALAPVLVSTSQNVAVYVEPNIWVSHQGWKPGCGRSARWCVISGMVIELGTPGVDGLDDAVGALREWQHDGAPMQLHPGDLGWFWRYGAEATAAAVRTWSRDGRIVAVGLLDEPDLLRMTIAPDAHQDEELARRVVEDVAEPARGVLVPGKVYVEAPKGALLQDLLFEAGWDTDDPWTPLRRDLAQPVEDPGVRVEVVGPARAHVRTAVQRASFAGSTFTDDSWRAMAAGSPYADARCLVAYDEQDNAVAAVTVWSAGAGRPGLIEPMGVHANHRGHGYGKAITVAAAAALRELGSSSVLVCTPSSNVGAVATYKSAGFEALPEVRDRRRDA